MPDPTWLFTLYPDVMAQGADLGRALRRAGPAHDLADVVGVRRSGGYPYTSGLPAIRPSSPLGCGSFQVIVARSYVPGDLGAEDAIDEVVSRLPAGCGPAIQGTAPDVG